MPTTLPGFLLVAGTLMVVLSLFDRPVEIKEFKLPTSNSSSRMALRVIGCMFLILSAYIYYPYVSGQLHDGKDLPPMLDVAPDN